MHRDRLERKLREIHRPTSPQARQMRHKLDLERKLSSCFQATHTHPRRYLMLLNPWHKTTRFALIGLAMITLTVGACSTSTVTDVELGQKVTLKLNATAKSYDEIVATLDQSKALDEFLRSQPGIENVSLNINESGDQGVTIELLAWGQHLDGDQLAADLRSQVPGLADAVIQTETLSGTIEESFASHLKHEIFQVDVDGATEEEIRAQILAELGARGIDEGATVEVHQSDGQTNITIQVEEEATD